MDLDKRRVFHAVAQAGSFTHAGEALALSTIVTSYSSEWANYAPLDGWLPEFESLLGGHPITGFRSVSR